MAELTGRLDNLIKATEDWMRPHVASAIAAELVAQADIIRARINAHGLGMRHGCDVGRSNYCEAWGRDEMALRARARELEDNLRGGTE